MRVVMLTDRSDRVKGEEALGRLLEVTNLEHTQNTQKRKITFAQTRAQIIRYEKANNP